MSPNTNFTPLILAGIARASSHASDLISSLSGIRSSWRLSVRAL